MRVTVRHGASTAARSSWVGRAIIQFQVWQAKLHVEAHLIVPADLPARKVDG
jgi:hypothetical protein